MTPFTDKPEQTTSIKLGRDAGLCNMTLTKGDKWKNSHQDHTQMITPLQLLQSQDGKLNTDTQAPQTKYQTQNVNTTHTRAHTRHEETRTEGC